MNSKKITDFPIPNDSSKSTTPRSTHTQSPWTCMRPRSVPGHRMRWRSIHGLPIWKTSLAPIEIDCAPKRQGWLDEFRATYLCISLTMWLLKKDSSMRELESRSQSMWMDTLRERFRQRWSCQYANRISAKQDFGFCQLDWHLQCRAKKKRNPNFHWASHANHVATPWDRGRGTRPFFGQQCPFSLVSQKIPGPTWRRDVWVPPAEPWRAIDAVPTSELERGMHTQRRSTAEFATTGHSMTRTTLSHRAALARRDLGIPKFGYPSLVKSTGLVRVSVSRRDSTHRKRLLRPIDIRLSELWVAPWQKNSRESTRLCA